MADFPNWKPADKEKLRVQAILEAWQDPFFRTQLDRDPEATLRALAGRLGLPDTDPADLKLLLPELLPLPPNPAGAETPADAGSSPDSPPDRTSMEALLRLLRSAKRNTGTDWDC